LVKIDLEWIKKFKSGQKWKKAGRNCRNELKNNLKLDPIGQNRYRMAQNVQNWVKIV